MVSTIKNEINYVSMPTDALIDLISKRDEFKELRFIVACKEYMSGGECFPLAWKKSLEDIRNTVYIRKKDIDIISAFGESFGITDSAGQISNCDLCLSRLEISRTEAIRVCEQYAKLSSGMGFILGIGILILFL